MRIKEFFGKLFGFYLWGNCLGMILLVVLLVLGVGWELDWYTHHGETAKVPLLIGQNYDTMKGKLKTIGLNVEVTDTGYVPTLAADIITQQDVEKGKIVKVGRTIHVTINSRHPKAVALPDLVDNSSYREALSQLRALGFKVRAPKLVSGEAEWVYGIEVGGKNRNAGDRVSLSDSVTLLIGDGHVYEEYTGNDSIDYSTNPNLYDSGEED